mgnify:CR=1 FL=1
MAGHSKWAQIKHQKAVTDVRRGQLFTKLTREIIQAVRQGGGPNPDANYRLRLAVQKAKDSNMPMENIERAIKRAAGVGVEGETLEEVTYEGYGPGGVAVMLQAITTNRNRTAGEVRSTFSRHGGTLGEAGCVAWNFEARGLITVSVDPARAEEVALMAIDAGAEDVKVDGGSIEVYTAPERVEDVRRQLEEQEVPVDSAEVTMFPKTTLALSPEDAQRTLRLLDALEALDDIQKVYSNAEFPDEVLEQYGKAS